MARTTSFDHKSAVKSVYTVYTASTYFYQTEGYGRSSGARDPGLYEYGGESTGVWEYMSTGVREYGGDGGVYTYHRSRLTCH